MLGVPDIEGPLKLFEFIFGQIEDGHPSEWLEMMDSQILRPVEEVYCGHYPYSLIALQQP